MKSVDFFSWQTDWRAALVALAGGAFRQKLNANCINEKSSDSPGSQSILRFNFIPVIGCQVGDEDWELRDQLGMGWAETREQSDAINLSPYKYVNTPAPLKHIESHFDSDLQLAIDKHCLTTFTNAFAWKYAM